MKPILLALLLSPALSWAAAPELICDPDAKVSFHSRWIRQSSVRLDASVSQEFPWTGKESVASGLDLKARLGRSEEPAAEELLALPDNSSFITYQEPGNPQALHVERELLQGQEHDGLVLVEIAPARFAVFHCRSR